MVFSNAPLSSNGREKDALRIRFFIGSIFMLGVVIFLFQLFVSDWQMSVLQFQLSVAIFLSYSLLLLFFSRLTLRFKVLMLTLLTFIPASLDLYSNGLMSMAKSALFLMPIVYAITFSAYGAYTLLVISVSIYAVAASGFAFGFLPVRHLEFLDYDLFFLLDALVILVLTVASVEILFRMKNQLIDSLIGITEKNLLLRKEEMTLKSIREGLEIKVDQRKRELDEAGEVLREKQERLKDQNQIYTLQKAELELKYSEIQRTQALLMQSRKLASLGSLSLGIAHEINNPLNFIKGGLLLLERRSLVVSDPDVKRLLVAMRTSSGHIHRIVRGLDQFRPADDRMDQTCDLQAIIEDCFLMLRGQLMESQKLEMENPGFAGLTRGNTGKLHQLFLNLLHNAIQSSPKAVVKVNFGRQQGTIAICISDNGEGIPAEIMTRIREPFFTTKEAGKGTGLGLHIASQIIHQHLGKMIFKSIPGEGTTVQVELPDHS